MRERLVSLVLAIAALAAFYALWLQPSAPFDPESDVPRPTTAERLGNGYAALFEWLQKSGVRTRSLRERYTELKDLELPARGNLLVLTLPAVEVFRNEEYSALDQWVRRGNTLLIMAALNDQPGWGAGRVSGAVAEIESLTGLEFENAEAREQRLDDTPLAQRVREDDERDARREAGEEDEMEEEEEESRSDAEQALEVPEDIPLIATGPHALLRDVSRLQLDTDYKAEDWSLRIPYDSFVLTLARTAQGEGALFEQRLGAGSILMSAGGSLFTNRALGSADNAQLFANIVSVRVARDGVVLFDDLRQGLSASYNPKRFYSDPRLFQTVLILLGLWLVWVVGSTRLRAPAIVEHDPSEAELVRRAGGLIARTVATHHVALRLFDHFFAGVARAVRGATGAPQAERGELWQWLERHAAILPQELDTLKTWYAAANSERKVPLVPLQNLLDTLGKTTQHMNNTVASFEQFLQRELARVIVGAEDVIRGLCIALIARGHVLLQGPPGLGKTLLAKTLARVLGGEFKRVQGTADLMPSDIVGTHVFDASKNEFVFRRGPLFADVLLVDEVNRTGPKTQSALLEAMEERQVSSERDMYPLPEDFLVLATQNPREFEGTYPLPESQLDRFMLRIDLNYPERAAEAEILKRYGTDLEAREAIPADIGTIDRAQLHQARAAASALHVSEALSNYVLDLARATREHPRIALGLSTRGVLALLRAARVHAGLRGADFVAPDDVQTVARWVLAHRLVLKPEFALDGDTDLGIVGAILDGTPVPR